MTNAPKLHYLSRLILVVERVGRALSPLAFLLLFVGFLCMGVGRGSRGAFPPGFWNFQEKKVIFLVLRGKKHILPLWPPPYKNFEKNPNAPSPGKNPSDAQVSVSVSHIFVLLFSARTKYYMFKTNVAEKQYCIRVIQNRKYITAYFITRGYWNYITLERFLSRIVCTLEQRL